VRGCSKGGSGETQAFRELTCAENNDIVLLGNLVHGCGRYIRRWVKKRKIKTLAKGGFQIGDFVLDFAG